MGDIIFNDALGYSRSLIQNVEDNSPVAAVLRLHAWVATATDATVRDITDANIDDIQATALIAEATNVGYGFTPLDETDIVITVNDGTDQVDIDISDQTDTAVSAGDNWTDLTLSYDADGSDPDTTTKGLWWLDFVVTPNGGDITANFPVPSFSVSQV
jgi:hypothetical protein